MVKRIFIVDDEPGVVLSVRRGLETLDKDLIVVPFRSGEKFFEFINENNKPDLILLDIMMPDMSGWEILKRIRSNPYLEKIPVIFLTARKDYVAKNAGEFLAEDYIEKPFRIPELKERIDKILNANPKT